MMRSHHLLSRTISALGTRGAHDKILRLRCKRQAIVTRGMPIEAHFPEILQPPAGLDAAQGQNVFGARLAPKHAGLLAASSDDRFASGLNDARADEEALSAEGAILHPCHVVDEVAQFFFHGLGL